MRLDDPFNAYSLVRTLGRQLLLDVNSTCPNGHLLGFMFNPTTVARRNLEDAIQGTITLAY